MYLKNLYSSQMEIGTEQGSNFNYGLTYTMN